jgi:hypothetical protein
VTTTTVTPWLQMAVHTIISASESAAVDEAMLFPVDLNKRTPRKLPQSAEKNSVDSFLFYFSSHFTEMFLSFSSLLLSQHILKLAIKPQRVVCSSYMISYSYRLSEMLTAAERFNINTPFLWGHWGPVAGEIFHFFSQSNIFLHRAGTKEPSNYLNRLKFWGRRQQHK